MDLSLVDVEDPCQPIGRKVTRHFFGTDRISTV
jgi:hypothetical protein